MSCVLVKFGSSSESYNYSHRNLQLYQHHYCMTAMPEHLILLG